MKKIAILFVIALFCAELNAQDLLNTIKYAHKMTPNTVAISDDGALIVSGGADKYTFIWNAKTGEKMKKLPRNIYSILSVDISSDGKLFSSVGVSKTIDIWNNETEKYVMTDIGHSASITCSEFSPDNLTLATGGYDDKVVVWDIASCKELRTLKHKSKVSDLSFDDSGNLLVTVSNKVILWNVNEGTISKEYDPGNSDCRSVDISPDATIIAVDKGLDIILLDANTLTEIGTLSGHKKQINKLRFSSDGKFLFSAGDDKNIFIWDIPAKSMLKNWEAHGHYIKGLDVSKNGELLVSCSDDNDIKIWDIKSLGISSNNFVVESLKESENISYNKVVVEDLGEEKMEEDDESLYRGGGDPLKGLNVSSAKKEMEIGDYYALIIGVDNYKGEWAKLENAVNDAKAIEVLLKTKYKFDHFVTLYNEQATRTQIIKQLEWLMNNVKEKDNVFIYYSGHGEYKQQLDKGFWVPVDATSKTTAQFISNNDIQTYLGGIKSKHTLLVSDACFSGDIFRGETISVPYENSDKYYNKVHELMSRQAMSSGGIEPVMDGGKNGHSVFAYYLIKSLTANTKKYYDASELYSNIKIPVTNNSDQSPKFQPIKNTGDEGGQFIFIKKQ